MCRIATLLVTALVLTILNVVFGWSHQHSTRTSSSSSSTTSRRGFFSQASGVAIVSGCATWWGEPKNSLAYPRRDVGGDDLSAITAAMNEQAYQTNNRLEASGFKLDSPEEEKARLSSALESFSYESSSKPNKQSTGFKSASSFPPKQAAAAGSK